MLQLLWLLFYGCHGLELRPSSRWSSRWTRGPTAVGAFRRSGAKARCQWIQDPQNLGEKLLLRSLRGCFWRKQLMWRERCSRDKLSYVSDGLWNAFVRLALAPLSPQCVLNPLCRCRCMGKGHSPHWGRGWCRRGEWCPERLCEVRIPMGNWDMSLALYVLGEVNQLW